MIDPMYAFKTTSNLLVPTSTHTASVSPIPTVIMPEPTYEEVGPLGAKALWVVFVIMFISSLAFIGMSYQVPVQKRLFHVLTAFITIFATISYFAMATGDGISFAHIIVTETSRHAPDTVEHVYRQVFWARYVDWTLTTPLLLLDLAFLAGLNGSSIIIAIVADLIMVLLGLFGAFGASESQKWAYYAMANAAYVVIVYQLVVSGRKTAATKDSTTAKLFASLGLFTFILWTLYPVVWAIGDGARMWSVDAEIMSYAILDVLAKPGFGFWLLTANARKTESIEGFWSHGLTGEGSLRVGDDE